MTEAEHDTRSGASIATLPILPFTWRDGFRVLSTLGMVLGGFTSLGALILLVYTHQNPAFDVIQSPGGLLFRFVAFGLITACFATCLWRLRERNPLAPPTFPPRRVEVRAIGLLVLLLTGILGLLVFRIGDYPWAAPDEIHHLNVARNLAIHGSYASGHPETGFTYFDSFDSVGPAVIVPVATGFRVFGVSLVVARAIVVAFFLVLCGAFFQFGRKLFGGWSGALSVGLLVGTFSSIYLGRTLYGEVPAFTFLLLGLLAWHEALEHPKRYAWGLSAGALIGLAVLSKSIVVLVVFSFAGVWAYDRVTFRKIHWVHVVLPTMGGLAVLSCWTLAQANHGPQEGADGGLLAIYQHYLLFGLESLPFALANSVVHNPVAHLVWLVVAVVSVPLVFRHRYTPAGAALYLYGVFMLYWWYFFTPGQLHRYLWNAYAIFALFSAPWLAMAMGEVLNRGASRRNRVLWACCVILLLAPGLRWVTLQGREIGTKVEMAEEKAIVRALAAFPQEIRIVTTSGRLPGLLNFFAGRSIDTGTGLSNLLGTYDVVVLPDRPENRADVPPGTSLKTVGGFVLLSSTKTLE